MTRAAGSAAIGAITKAWSLTVQDAVAAVGTLAALTQAFVRVPFGTPVQIAGRAGLAGLQRVTSSVAGARAALAGLQRAVSTVTAPRQVAAQQMRQQAVGQGARTTLAGQARQAFSAAIPRATVGAMAGRLQQITQIPRSTVCAVKEDMAQIIEKRSSETLPYDLVCASMLASGETISAAQTPTYDANTGSALTFSVPSINATAKTYADGSVAPIGTVITVQIGGGSIPAGMPYLDYLVRVKFTTNVVGVVREATARLRVQDIPS
jgi:hypothetical protein